MDFEKHGLSYRLPPLIAIRLLLYTDSVTGRNLLLTRDYSYLPDISVSVQELRLMIEMHLSMNRSYSIDESLSVTNQ